MASTTQRCAGWICSIPATPHGRNCENDSSRASDVPDIRHALRPAALGRTIKTQPAGAAIAPARRLSSALGVERMTDSHHITDIAVFIGYFALDHGHEW